MAGTRRRCYLRADPPRWLIWRPDQDALRGLTIGFLPPLAPPVLIDQELDLRLPAVREIAVGVQVVQAVAAVLLAVRMRLEARVLDEVLELQRIFFVDFGRFRRRRVRCFGHGGKPTDTLGAMRIARFTAGNEPAYGVVEGDRITQMDGHP